MNLEVAPSDRDVRTRPAASRNVDLETLYVIVCVSACCERSGGREIIINAIRWGACYYSIVLNACRVTSMGDTGIDAVKKQRNAEYAKQYRMKRKLLTYKWFGTFIIKDGRYTFTFLESSCANNKHSLLHSIPIHFSTIPCELTIYTNTHEQQPYCVGTLSQMTERSAKRRVRQETGWLAGGTLLRVPTIRRTTDTYLRHIPFHFPHNEHTPVQISLQYLYWC
jgi:hypothetical protein